MDDRQGWEDRRGMWHEFCAIPECPGLAQWIPIARAQTDQHTYYCTRHTTEIDAAAERVQESAELTEE